MVTLFALAVQGLSRLCKPNPAVQARLCSHCARRTRAMCSRIFCVKKKSHKSLLERSRMRTGGCAIDVVHASVRCLYMERAGQRACAAVRCTSWCAPISLLVRHCDASCGMPRRISSRMQNTVAELSPLLNETDRFVDQNGFAFAASIRQLPAIAVWRSLTPTLAIHQSRPDAVQ